MIRPHHLLVSLILGIAVGAGVGYCGGYYHGYTKKVKEIVEDTSSIKGIISDWFDE